MPPPTVSGTGRTRRYSQGPRFMPRVRLQAASPKMKVICARLMPSMASIGFRKTLKA